MSDALLIGGFHAVQAALLPADAATTPVAQALNEATAPLAPEPPLLPRDAAGRARVPQALMQPYRRGER